jgi:hypothetical protein
MPVIPVPKPSKKAMNPNRPANALLLSQVSHLQHAERRLPLKYRTEIYTHAIQTEGEAARYIREVTEAIHQAHDDAERERTKGRRARKTTAAKAAKRKSRSNVAREGKR